MTRKLISRFLVIEWLNLHFLDEDGARNGLNGGNRANGGASNVNYNWRDDANDNLAFRLVLSRKHYCIIFLLDNVYTM